VEQALKEFALRQENLRLPLAQIPESVTGIAVTGTEAIHIPPEGIDFESPISQMKKQYLQSALQSAWGERRKAAALSENVVPIVLPLREEIWDLMGSPWVKN